MKKTLQGIFKPANPQKYKGDPTKIVYRSSWELKFMFKCDQEKDIIEWSSEEIIIPYRSPLDGKIHRYFPDFFIKMINDEKRIRKIIVEIKPYKECIAPLLKEGKKNQKSYINSVTTYAINQKKWEAAQEFCKKKEYEFIIMNEYDLGISKRK